MVSEILSYTIEHRGPWNAVLELELAFTRTGTDLILVLIVEEGRSQGKHDNKGDKNGKDFRIEVSQASYHLDLSCPIYALSVA